MYYNRTGQAVVELKTKLARDKAKTVALQSEQTEMKIWRVDLSERISFFSQSFSFGGRLGHISLKHVSFCRFYDVVKTSSFAYVYVSTLVLQLGGKLVCKMKPVQLDVAKFSKVLY